jgi:hypothetical protein
MPNSKFRNDFAVGQIAESYVHRLLNGCGLVAASVDKANRDFWDVQAVVPADWKLSDNLVKLEVKFDKFHQKTGNIAIEIWNTKLNKPSGLSSTKADLWVCVLHDSMWVANVALLKTYVFNTGTKPKRIVENAGDNNAMIYLYNDEDILKMFRRVDDMSKTEALKNLKELCQIKF